VAPSGGPPTSAKKQIVISVPHSGTRTLMDYLKIYATEQGLWGAGEWWHFGGRFDPLIARNPHHAHIPIRHPLDVAASWARRHRTGKPFEDLIRRYGRMFAYMADPEHEFTLHRMEDLPRLRGMSEHVDENRDSKVKRYREEIKVEVIEPNREFFERFYKDLDRGFELV
jgi:hypothetical protein